MKLFKETLNNEMSLKLLFGSTNIIKFPNELNITDYVENRNVWQNVKENLYENHINILKFDDNE